MGDNYMKSEKFFEPSTELFLRTVKVSFSYDNSSESHSLYERIKGLQQNIFTERRVKPKQVLNNCSVNVPRAKIYSLLGSSGCGKTTLLKCILGIEKVSSGSVKIFQNQDELVRFKGKP